MSTVVRLFNIEFHTHCKIQYNKINTYNKNVLYLVKIINNFEVMI